MNVIRCNRLAPPEPLARFHKSPRFSTFSYGRKKLPTYRIHLQPPSYMCNDIQITRNLACGYTHRMQYIKQRVSSNMPLTQSTDPLVWIDCEMTGLNPKTDTILSISCYITDHMLEHIDSTGYHAIISTSASALSSMDEWCIRTHTATGLVDACQSSSAISASQAATELLEYIKRHVPTPCMALLAGNSVHADRMLLMQSPWTPILEWLHYRILDVSAIKEAVRRWAGQEIIQGVPEKKLAHSADEDIQESLEEAKYYMRLFQDLGKTRSQPGQ